MKQGFDYFFSDELHTVTLLLSYLQYRWPYEIQWLLGIYVYTKFFSAVSLTPQTMNF